MANNPDTPANRLGPDGQRLWDAVHADYEMDVHEEDLLMSSCRVLDHIAGLEAIVRDEGYMAESAQGPKVHPALVELRAQHVVHARLIAALNLPSGEQSDGVKQRRAVRGVYRVEGCA